MMIIQSPFFGLFGNVDAFLVGFIVFGGFLGLLSHKLAMAGYGSILSFSYVVINTDRFIFDSILYLILTIIILFLSAYLVGNYTGDNQGVEE